MIAGKNAVLQAAVGNGRGLDCVCVCVCVWGGGRGGGAMSSLVMGNFEAFC